MHRHVKTEVYPHKSSHINKIVKYTGTYPCAENPSKVKPSLNTLADMKLMATLNEAEKHAFESVSLF